VTLGLLTGVTANAAAPPPALFCSGELPAATTKVTSVYSDVVYRLEIPGWLQCSGPQFAVAEVEQGIGYIYPRSIKDNALGGHTTFTVLKEVGPGTSLCLMAAMYEVMHLKTAVSCLRLVQNGDSVTVVQTSPRQYQSTIPIQLRDDDTTPPTPECPSCW
jgi:hypothetical protein